MKKVIIIGCPGSGKTTFAEKLQRVTNLPLYYLDAIWHKPDRTHISREEYDKKLSEIFRTEEWIIDGNYSRTIEQRIHNSDTIFLFDFFGRRIKRKKADNDNCTQDNGHCSHYFLFHRTPPCSPLLFRFT